MRYPRTYHQSAEALGTARRIAPAIRPRSGTRLSHPFRWRISPVGGTVVEIRLGGRISRFTSEGEYIGSFGEFGEGPGQFRTPHAMAFDSQGRLFVADRGNNRIQIFDADYAFVDEWAQFGRPNDVFIDGDDTMYVLDSESGDDRNPGMRRGIYIGSARDGTLTAFVPGHESSSPYGTIGEGIAVDAAGHLYVGEVSVDGVTRFTPE